jgi:thiamine biosynthesis lipoprotein
VSAEAIERFECFGSECAVYVEGAGAAAAAARARARMLAWHVRFSRFIASSELSQRNRDPRDAVPVSSLLAKLAASARDAAELSGGLVDATLLGELSAAGYDGELPPALPLSRALQLAPARRPARPAPGDRWRDLDVDEDALVVRRPPGLMLDSGGLAKGLFADELLASLSQRRSVAIDCGGDLALGGAAGVQRVVEVHSPFDEAVLHRFRVARGGVATTGIGRRSWLDSSGRPAHHLLDPASGRPAYTGIVQATALAPSGALAEVHAKAAVLSGPEGAAGWLRWGGVVVLDDGSHRVVEPDGGR